MFDTQTRIRRFDQESRHKRHRYPPEIISYAIWRYYRFSLSYRDIEDSLAPRGVIVS